MVDLLIYKILGSDYNQVLMYKEDKKKTTFIIEEGMYYLIVMLFGLWNVGTTFQILIDNIFENQIGQNVEAYVDNILVFLKT